MTSPSPLSPTPAPQAGWVIAVHWTTVLLVLIAAAAILIREGLDDRALRLVLLQIHRSSGLSVLLLTLMRVLVSPRIKRNVLEGTRLHRLAAGLSHAVLYGLLLLIPIFGWALSSARGQAIHLLGVIPVPALLGRDRDLADQLQDLHEVLAITLLVLVALHSVAALWHHYVRRDAVLRSMLPGGLRR